MPNYRFDLTQVTWQSMESAPRDGTRILVAFRSHGVVSVAWQEAVSGIEIWCVDDFKFGPYAVRGYTETGVLGWMPLPEMP